jgi:hypothetical protein
MCGHIAFSRLELDTALELLREGEHALASQHLVEGMAETLRALGYQTVEEFLKAERK